MPVNVRKALQNESRSPDGRPGKNYWQNRADYDLDITFDPDSRRLNGKAAIQYFNNSPDTLKKIVLRNYPDFYRKDALRDFPIEANDENEGVTISRLMLNGKEIPFSDHKQFYRNGTVMTIYHNLAPHGQCTIDVSWSYELAPASSHVRTGEVSEGAFFIGYFFPRIAVYDDLEGWDESQYAGIHEPYAGYDDFDVSISVPEGYLVFATGEWQNPEEILQPDIYNRYLKAQTSDSTIYIVSQRDTDIVKTSKPFIYKANDVPDFAFAISNHYLWMAKSLIADSHSGRRCLVSTAFNPEHDDYYEVMDFAEKCIRFMRDSMPGISYPYPHLTIFDGLDQMEFPMLVNDNPVSDRHECITLTVHEAFHMLLPFYTGANQTRYAWMDEGWATFSEWVISPMIDSTIHDDFSLSYSRNNSGKEWDTPLIVSSTEWKRSYRMNAYNKFALVLLYMQDMLGKQVFNACMKGFLSEWSGKHPSPWDFFNTFNRLSGQDLNWFWKKWFYDYGEVDPSLTVKWRGKKALILVNNPYKPVPFIVQITSEGGITEWALPASVWINKTQYRRVAKGFRRISAIKIHHDYVPDVNTSNNVYYKND